MLGIATGASIRTSTGGGPGSARRASSSRPGVGARPAGARSVRTSERMSASTACASVSMTRSDSATCAGSADATCARMTIAETWCATVSCRSRASASRSRERTESACLARDSTRSRRSAPMRQAPPMNATAAMRSATGSLPRRLVNTNPAVTTAAPTTRSRPAPQRNTAYGTVRNANVATSAFGSIPAMRCASAKADVDAVMTATLASGADRRHSRTGRIAIVTSTVASGHSRSGRTAPSNTDTRATPAIRIASRALGPSPPAARGRAHAPIAMRRRRFTPGPLRAAAPGGGGRRPIPRRAR
ncbi:MAG: hypothetical protein HOQ43_14060 [Glycomyces artemisiae]|uniref:Uncharacterized protein n=1 Tax=Glycomyces artemisiae TaxID=1076443 RepID=A0A850CCB2_9ACTN|nr:hypothetical protein [Glycomyces artemisiae]